MRIIFFISLFFSYLFASINWYEDYNEALKLSKKSKKPLFIFIERKNPPCRWCEMMKNTTLKDEEISNYINKTFIPLKLTKQQSNYPKKLHPKYIPAIYILTPNEKIVKKIIGYWGREDFLSDLEDIKRDLN